eukprot:927240-Prymnesium_polylepis.2
MTSCPKCLLWRSLWPTDCPLRVCSRAVDVCPPLRGRPQQRRACAGRGRPAPALERAGRRPNPYRERAQGISRRGSTSHVRRLPTLQA